MFLEWLTLSVIVTISHPFIEEIGNLSGFASQVHKSIKRSHGCSLQRPQPRVQHRTVCHYMLAVHPVPDLNTFKLGTPVQISLMFEYTQRKVCLSCILRSQWNEPSVPSE